MIARFARMAYTFVMMNVAAVTGFVAWCRGRKVWK
jgi:hypothetical protein